MANQLSKLVRAALDGEDVIIANHGKPMVLLVKLANQSKTRGYGAWKHLPPPTDDWDNPATNAAIAKFVVDRSMEPREPARVPQGPAVSSEAAGRRKAHSRTPFASWLAPGCASSGAHGPTALLTTQPCTTGPKSSRWRGEVDPGCLTGLHHDPVDCLLLGLARSERLPLLTRDAQLLERAKPLLGDLIVQA